MKKLQIFDPALCCNTGVCGTEVDQALVDFSADADWLKQAGITVERFNLAQQPLAFAENDTVKNFLHEQGDKALPLILLDGKIALSGRYPTRQELAQWLGIALPATSCSAPTASAASSACCASPDSAGGSATKCCG